jgi:hypothetical protein
VNRNKLSGNVREEQLASNLAANNAYEIDHGLNQVSTALLSSAPLGERMADLCKGVASILNCGRCSVLLWDGDCYQVAYNYGIPEHLGEHFHSTALVPSHRFGLLSMRERAEAAGGTFSISSSAGDGTTITAWIPSSPETQGSA